MTKKSQQYFTSRKDTPTRISSYKTPKAFDLKIHKNINYY